MNDNHHLAADDSAQQALWHALQRGGLPPLDGPVLVVRGLAAMIMPAARDWDWLQSFRPQAEGLLSAGLKLLPTPPAPGHYAQVLLLAPRQREEARAAMACALDWLRPGGRLLVAAANNEGARSVLADLQALAGLDGELSKHKCRVGWVQLAPARIDPRRRSEWAALDAIRRAPSGYYSRPGLFAWDRVDAASALLSAHLPADLAGRAADLGAGWGYLSAHLLRHCPGLQSLDLYEAEARALPAAELNLQQAAAESGRELPLRLLWADVSRGLQGRYEVVVSNPPFHLGKADVPALGRAFIRAAAEALVPSGQLWLVANRHLPYETLLQQRFDQVQTLADVAGFKLIKAAAVRPGTQV